MNLVNLSIEQGDYAEAAHYLLQGLDLARVTGHRLLLCYLLQNQGMLALRQNRVDEADAALREASTLARDLANPSLMAITLTMLAEVAMARGDFTMAENYLREALSLGEQVEDARTLCTVYLRWGKLRLTQHGADAQSFFQRTLEIAQRVGLRVEEAEAYFGLAQVAAREGDSILARQHGEASRISYQAIGHTMTKTLDMWLSKMA